MENSAQTKYDIIKNLKNPIKIEKNVKNHW